MSCPNLFQNPNSEVNVSSVYGEHLTKFIYRIASVFCLVLLDTTGLTVAISLASVLLNEVQIWNNLLPLLPVFILFLLLVMSSLHLYDRLLYRRRYSLVVLGFSIPWLASLLISHHYETFVGGDSLLLLSWSIALPIVVVGRQKYDAFVDNFRRAKSANTITLFIGNAQAAAQLEGASPGILTDRHIIGRISSDEYYDSGAIGTIEELPYLLEKYAVRCILLAASALTPELLRHVVQHCDYANVNLLVLQPPLPRRKCLSIFNSPELNQSTVLEVGELWSYTAQSVGKRVIDFLGAGLGTLFLSPLMLIVALLIRLDSKGPIFFRQQRIGRGGKLFFIWKFRTMAVNAEKCLKDLEQLNESEGGVLFKMKDDPRVTRIGKILRRTSLDELPQLFNVLQGHMSLVGPRPLQLRDCNLAMTIKAYRDAFAKRVTLMPGVTGLWQVSGRSEIAFEDMLHLDIEYIENWSLWLDLRIIWQTVLVIFTGKGAY